MKINNKGLTLVELVVSMAIVSVVVISMFNVVMSYQTEEMEQSIRSDIIEYKNIVTKAIQDDFISHQMNGVTYNGRSTNGNGVTYTFTFEFEKGWSNGKREKILQVFTDAKNGSNNYIKYQDYNGSSFQDVKYTLPIRQTGNCSTTNCDIIKFTTVDTNLYNNADPTSSISAYDIGENIFYLDITISVGTAGSDYHVLLLAPIDYSFCKAN